MMMAPFSLFHHIPDTTEPLPGRDTSYSTSSQRLTLTLYRRGPSPLRRYCGRGAANGIGREREKEVVQKVALLQVPDEDDPQLLVSKALGVEEEEAGACPHLVTASTLSTRDSGTRVPSSDRFPFFAWEAGCLCNSFTVGFQLNFIWKYGHRDANIPAHKNKLTTKVVHLVHDRPLTALRQVSFDSAHEIARVTASASVCIVNHWVFSREPRGLAGFLFVSL